MPNPVVVLYLIGAALLYARAVRILDRRGRRVPRRQQAAWWGGLVLMAAALVSPIDDLGSDLLALHMVQHVLIADLAAPLLITGMRNPVLAFLLPRSVLVPLARSPLRRVFRILHNPGVALTLFLFVLYGWHLRGPFEAAVESDLVHALQHISFVASSLLVWWAVLEPKKRRMPGELWKIGHIFGSRLISAMLGMGMIFSRSPWYPGAYDGSGGLTALGDQQTAGGIMMSLDFLVIAFALSLFFWRSASDFDREVAVEQPGQT